MSGGVGDVGCLIARRPSERALFKMFQRLRCFNMFQQDYQY